MSAMRAEELPELPEFLTTPGLSPATPPDSAQTRAAARWTALLAPAAPAQAPAAPAQAPAKAPAQAPAAPSPVRIPRPANPPLRLTRRGRIVVAVAVMLVLAALSLVIAGAAQATNHPVASGAAQRNVTQVTVHPGQSLWSVAESADPAADTRVVIQQIIELNSLTGNVVFAGQRLWVPRG